VAATIRQFIANEVADGSSDEEIRNDLLRAYGARVLLTPPAEGLASLLWILPVVLVVGGAAGLALMVDRSRAKRSPEALSKADREMVRLARAARSGEEIER
jgi:cytochrome c-type biogenesis protein CcmH/NrfF